MSIGEGILLGFGLIAASTAVKFGKSLMQEREARKELGRASTEELQHKKRAVEALVGDNTLDADERKGARRFCQLIDRELLNRSKRSRRAPAAARKAPTLGDVAGVRSAASAAAGQATPVEEGATFEWATPLTQNWSAYEVPAYLRL